MANEKVNKVVLGSETLIDLTSDTVSANNLLSGATAHDSRGEQIQGNVSVPTDLDDLSDVNLSSPALGDSLFHDGTEWVNKNLMVEVTKAEYDALVANNEDDPDVDYHITDIDVAEAYYVETSGQTALTGATSLTFTNSHITPTSDIRILAEPASCKVSTNPQYKVSAKLSSVGNGTATITFPALAENTTFWLLIECPLAVTVDPAYVYNTDETVIGQWLGKPLYRKVIQCTSPASASTNETVYTGLDATMDIKNIYGALYYSATSSYPIQFYQTPTNYISTWRRTDAWLGMNVGSSTFTNKDVYVVLEYTKTTD